MIKEFINVASFGQHLTRMGIEPSLIHNFLCLHKAGGILPKQVFFRTREEWMGAFEAYIKMLRCVRSNFRREHLLAD